MGSEMCIRDRVYTKSIRLVNHLGLTGDLQVVNDNNYLTIVNPVTELLPDTNLFNVSIFSSDIGDQSNELIFILNQNDTIYSQSINAHFRGNSDPDIIIDDTLEVMEDISSYFTLILEDEENDSVIVEIENYNPYHIQGSIENGQLYIVPALNWFGGTLLTLSLIHI